VALEMLWRYTPVKENPMKLTDVTFQVDPMCGHVVVTPNDSTVKPPKGDFCFCDGPEARDTHLSRYRKKRGWDKD